MNDNLHNNIVFFGIVWQIRSYQPHHISVLYTSFEIKKISCNRSDVPVIKSKFRYDDLV